MTKTRFEQTIVKLRANKQIHDKEAMEWFIMGVQEITELLGLPDKITWRNRGVPWNRGFFAVWPSRFQLHQTEGERLPSILRQP